MYVQHRKRKNKKKLKTQEEEPEVPMFVKCASAFLMGKEKYCSLLENYVLPIAHLFVLSDFDSVGAILLLCKF